GGVHLAASAANALAGAPVIALGALPAGPHMLTRAITFANVQSLTGGTGNHTFLLALQSVTTFSGTVRQIDGGAGAHTLHVLLAAGAMPQPTDLMVWGVTGQNVGWVADCTARPLITGPVSFDQSAVGSDGATLTLPGHRLQTGDAVVFHPTGAAITNLT